MDRSKSWSTETSAEELLFDTLATMRRTVSRQVQIALRAFLRRDAGLSTAVLVKDGYVDNLNSQAQVMAHHVDLAGNPRLAHCGWTIAANLEHIGDYAVNIAKQRAFRGRDEPPPDTHPLESYRRLILRGLTLAKRALQNGDMNEAFAVCRLEEKIDALYAADLAVLIEQMGQGGEAARDALTWAFAIKNLERMGDMLLNMGEAVLSMICGEKVKLDHLRSIEEFLPTSRLSASTIHGGTSGAFVALLEDEKGRYIFKGGGGAKLAREYENLLRWNETLPHVVPKVLRSPDHESGAGLLLEHIPGPTLEDVILRQEDELEGPLDLVMALITRMWKTTRQPLRTESTFVSQIRARLTELFDLHPSLKPLRATRMKVGTQEFPSVAQLLDLATAREKELACPFRVLLHGDFNLSNLILTTAQPRYRTRLEADSDGRCVRMVDVTRSDHGDPAQDLSVLMVSCVRHPLAVEHAAGRARWFHAALESRGRALARELGDPHFDRRLLLGLARSYMTSGRVLQDSNQARILYLRGIRVLEDFLCVR